MTHVSQMISHFDYKFLRDDTVGVTHQCVMCVGMCVDLKPCQHWVFGVLTHVSQLISTSL